MRKGGGPIPICELELPAPNGIESIRLPAWMHVNSAAMISQSHFYATAQVMSATVAEAAPFLINSMAFSQSTLAL